MSKSTVITEGFGSFGTANFVITEGFGNYGTTPPTVPYGFGLPLHAPIGTKKKKPSRPKVEPSHKEAESRVLALQVEAARVERDLEEQRRNIAALRGQAKRSAELSASRNALIERNRQIQIQIEELKIKMSLRDDEDALLLMMMMQ